MAKLTNYKFFLRATFRLAQCFSARVKTTLVKNLFILETRFYRQFFFVKLTHINKIDKKKKIGFMMKAKMLKKVNM